MSQPDYRAAVAAGVKRSAAQCIRRDSPPRPLSHNPVPHQQHPTYHQQPHNRTQHQPHNHQHNHYQQQHRPSHAESHDKKRAVAPRTQPQQQQYLPQPRPAQPQHVRPQLQQPSRVVPQLQPQSQPHFHSHPAKQQPQQPQSQQRQQQQQQPAPFQPQCPVPRRPTNHSRLTDEEQVPSFLPNHRKREEEKEQERDDDEPLCEAEEGLVSSTLHITHSWADIVQNEHKNNTLAPVTTTSTSRSRPSSASASSSRRPPQHSPLSAAYFASLLPVNKEQQKHIDRQSRHAHDIAHSRDAVISVLSCILEQLFPMKETETLPADVSLITMFHTERVPSISISQYLQRLATYTECSSEVLIQSIIHINRILHHRPSFKINSLNIHRLLLTSLLCSAKFFDDLYYNNAYYARVGGIGNRELNELEIEFLALINFDLFVEFAVYSHFYNELASEKLHQHCACQYRRMPAIDVRAYQLPEECKWDDEEEAEDETLEEEDDEVGEELDEKCEDEEEEEEEEDEEVEEADTVVAVVKTQHSAVRDGGITTLSPSTTASSSSDDDEEDEEDVVESEEDEADDAVLLMAGDKAMTITEPGTLDRQSSSASTLSVSRSMDSLAVDNAAIIAAVATVPAAAPAVTVLIINAPAVPIVHSASVPIAHSASVPMSDSPVLTSRNPIKIEARSVIREITSFPLPPQPVAPPTAHITYQQFQVAEYYYGHHYVSVEGFHITPHPYYPPPPPPPPPHSYQHAYYQPPPPPPSHPHPIMGHISGQTHAHPMSHPTSQLHTPILGSVM